jgi:hypothetical protein
VEVLDAVYNNDDRQEEEVAYEGGRQLATGSDVLRELKVNKKMFSNIFQYITWYFQLSLFTPSMLYRRAASRYRFRLTTPSAAKMKISAREMTTVAYMVIRVKMFNAHAW